MAVQRSENGGQKRLLKHIGSEQLSFQDVPHRFGRFVAIIVRVFGVILKKTNKPSDEQRQSHKRSRRLLDRRHVRLASYGMRSMPDITERIARVLRRRRFRKTRLRGIPVLRPQIHLVSRNQTKRERKTCGMTRRDQDVKTLVMVAMVYDLRRVVNIRRTGRQVRA